MKSIFLPTRRTELFFIGIVAIILVWALFSFPISGFLSGKVDDVSFRIGWPYSFFELRMDAPNLNPINFMFMIYSLLGYFVFAYLLDVVFSLIIWFWNKPIYRSVNLDASDEIMDAYTQAKEAYGYYKRKGISEEKIIEMFKERGWKEEDARKIMD